ncbi:MAG: serine--tRNA ligase [Pseudomonadota bacterium]|nr:serine--tRNA ligase [Pseudomonadota bacterium]
MNPSQTMRKELESIKEMVKSRAMSLSFEEYEQLETRRKQLQQETESIQKESNDLSKSVGLKRRNGEDTSELLKSLERISTQKKALEQELRELLDGIRAFELQVPNLLDENVPVGVDESDNQEILQYGTLPKFSFTPKSHVELAAGDLDFSAAAKISGKRFVLMKGNIAKLHRALGQWMLDFQTKRGYEEVNPPLLVEHHALEGTGQLPKFADDQFFTEGHHALIPTAEVSVTNIHREEIVDYSSLPISYAALTPCFRKEAGAYGKDTHGMIRLHQFEKVELVKFVTEEQAEIAFNQLIEDAEAVLQALQLPYRKVLLCSGDTGFSSKITYDLEVWLPGENQYREISSCSYFGDFQARRLQARYRDEDGKVQLLHTLNGSGLAVGRTLVAFLENNQTAEGRIMVPEVIKPYMGVDEF